MLLLSCRKQEKMGEFECVDMKRKTCVAMSILLSTIIALVTGEILMKQNSH